MKQVSKRQFAVNSFWKIIESFSSHGISMLVSIVLARLLFPTDFGLIALTNVFINLSGIIDSGFYTSLIRKQEVDDYDCSAVFLVSTFISAFLYTILFFSAPFVSDYYNEPDLTPVLRAIGLTFFIQSVFLVRYSIINRNMQFRLLFLCNSIAGIASGIIGITAAYCGFGVWAIVAQRLSQQVVLGFMLFVKVKRKIRWRFSFFRVKEILSFSISVTGSYLLNYLGTNIYGAVIGKKYSVTDLGYYDKGEQLPRSLSSYTFGAMSNVLLPTISSSQSDLHRVKKIIRKVVIMTSFLIMPMMAGIALTGKEIVCIIFTEKWLPSVPIIPYMCLYYLATPYMLINVQLFFAFGRSELRVKTEVIRLVLMAIGLGVFGFALNCSMTQLAFVGALIAVAVTLITYFEARKLIFYSTSEVIKDIAKPFICTAIMTVAVICVSMLTGELAIMFSLLIKAGTGMIVYAMVSLLCKSEGAAELLSLLKRKQ